MANATDLGLALSIALAAVDIQDAGVRHQHGAGRLAPPDLVAISAQLSALHE